MLVGQSLKHESGSSLEYTKDGRRKITDGNNKREAEEVNWSQTARRLPLENYHNG